MRFRTANTDAFTKLKKLIHEGEGYQLDFKEKVDDPVKIATSISAFANSAGGRLIIGVKDSGGLRGINPEEEEYMINLACSDYLRPNVEPKFKLISNGKKHLLEVHIKESHTKPVKSKDKNGKLKTYFRFEDNTVLSSKTYEEILKKRSSDQGSLITYGEAQKFLLGYLDENEFINQIQFSRKAKIPFWKAGKILTRLTCSNILQIHVSLEEDQFSLTQQS